VAGRNQASAGFSLTRATSGLERWLPGVQIRSTRGMCDRRQPARSEAPGHSRLSRPRSGGDQRGNDPGSFPTTARGL